MQNSEVLLTLIMITVCWDVTACSLVQNYHVLEKCTTYTFSLFYPGDGDRTFLRMVVNFCQFTQCCTPVDSYFNVCDLRLSALLLKTQLLHMLCWETVLLAIKSS